MKSEKEARILKAAEKVFLKKGFFPTHIDDIAEEAGIAKGTVYLYFRDKASIYVALLDKHLSRAIGLLEAIKKEKTDVIKKMERIFDEGSELFSHFKGMFPLVSVENINLTAEIMKEIRVKIKPKIKRIINSLAEIIREGIKNKELKKIDARLGALIFFSMVRVGFLASAYAPELKKQSEKIKNIFFYGIKPN
uniref:TetR/AcrR family transcriptional regulator n=1 Tax=candidate division WOR-3 bacterium TaxID=2052148 RepID=A0A7C6E9H2_UNCW3